MNFNDAENYCISMGYHLVSIHNAFENNFIQKTGAIDFGTVNGLIRIGLNTTNKFDWYWTDQSQFDYWNWEPGELIHVITRKTSYVQEIRLQDLLLSHRGVQRISLDILTENDCLPINTVVFDYVIGDIRFIQDKWYWGDNTPLDYYPNTMNYRATDRWDIIYARYDQAARNLSWYTLHQVRSDQAMPENCTYSLDIQPSNY
ncbi:hypothetical protein WR25_20663 [Diploscapter pachys]|uniref:C-type lectin domain-containing protein n=1 Tax=Diploscapter pachys TaxID=2018661 RepID=A0A2A2L2M8_9BILA|nr:hypothetical protein WR25_20663 [Diploscapter pachys]